MEEVLFTERDLREIQTRRARHEWIRGSSGYAGYALDPKADGQISVFGMDGERLPLPCTTEDELVIEAEALTYWKARDHPRRGQWVPDTAAAA